MKEGVERVCLLITYDLRLRERDQKMVSIDHARRPSLYHLIQREYIGTVKRMDTACSEDSDSRSSRLTIQCGTATFKGRLLWNGRAKGRHRRIRTSRSLSSCKLGLPSSLYTPRMPVAYSGQKLYTNEYNSPRFILFMIIIIRAEVCVQGKEDESS